MSTCACWCPNRGHDTQTTQIARTADWPVRSQCATMRSSYFLEGLALGAFVAVGVSCWVMRYYLDGIIREIKKEHEIGHAKKIRRRSVSRSGELSMRRCSVINRHCFQDVSSTMWSDKRDRRERETLVLVIRGAPFLWIISFPAILRTSVTRYSVLLRL